MMPVQYRSRGENSLYAAYERVIDKKMKMKFYL